MPYLWLDILFLSISAIISCALSLISFSFGPRRILNITFSLFTLARAIQAGFGIALRLSLWAGQGDALMLTELTVPPYIIVCVGLMMFAVRFVERDPKWTDCAAYGLAALGGLLLIPLFQGQLITNVYLSALGNQNATLSPVGTLIMLLPILALSWSLIVFWQGRQQTGGNYMTLSLFIMLLGPVLGSIIKVPFPVTSITSSISIAILGYGVLKHQLFNPLRERTRDLQREITERIKAETAQHNSEDRLRSVVENSPDLILEVDRAGKVIFANRYADFFLSKHVGELVLPEYAAMVVSAVDRTFATGERLSIEIQTRTIDDRITWDSVRVGPIMQAGKVTSLALISTDITERKRAELALQESEAMYRRAIMAAGAVPYYLDHRTRTYTFMGEGILPMTGYTAEEMNPDLWLTLEQEGFPRGNLAHLTYEEADRITEEDNSIPWECDYRIRTRDGSTRWVADTSVKGLNEKGDRVGVIGILQDITERKLAEQALKRYADRLEMLRQIDHAILAAHSPEETALAAVTRIRNIIACERAGVTLFDMEARQSMLLAASYRTETILGPLSPYTFEDCGLSTIEHIKQGQPFIDEDILTRADQTRLDKVFAEQGLRARLITPLMDQGRLIGALNLGRNAPGPFSAEELIIAKDVADQLSIAMINSKLYKALQTANTDLEQRVAARTAELESANQDLEAFSFSVSHDLRAPLRAVNSFSKILADDFSGNLEPQAKRFLGRIQENALKMNSLIEGLLVFSRVGRAAIARRDTDLKQLAQSTYDELLEGQDPARQFEFTLADLPAAQVDPILFKQVFSNLISNAIKYTGRRAVARIDVGALQKEAETVIFVRDNGTGFDMQYASKLFGVFQRLHSESEFEGTGIGLSTVARIIQKHGGRIWAEAEPDKGATFYFTLGKSE